SRRHLAERAHDRAGDRGPVRRKGLLRCDPAAADGRGDRRTPRDTGASPSPGSPAGDFPRVNMPVFLTGNGRDVSDERAARQALFDPQGRRFVESLVEQELLRQHARSLGLSVSADELQKAANEMRYERGLKERERTLEWVRAHAQTPESVEDQIELFL